MSKWFDFNQNNSRGVHDFEDLTYGRGISVHVIIEADSAEDANKRAEEIGLYFGRYKSGLDCECCGLRWTKESQGEPGDDQPSIYGKPLSRDGNHFHYATKTSWAEAGCPEGFVHYKDGTVLPVWVA